MGFLVRKVIINDPYNTMGSAEPRKEKKPKPQPKLARCRSCEQGYTYETYRDRTGKKFTVPAECEDCCGTGWRPEK
jgi:hypothetical protein